MKTSSRSAVTNRWRRLGHLRGCGVEYGIKRCCGWGRCRWGRPRAQVINLPVTSARPAPRRYLQPALDESAEAARQRVEKMLDEIADPTTFDKIDAVVRHRVGWSAAEFPDETPASLLRFLRP